jgi:hypothetical protein
MQVLKSYFFWTYERGSFHYDVMVTLILLFLFVSPRFIDYKDRPVAAVPLRASEVLVREQGSTGTEARFVYEIPVAEMRGATTDAEVRAAILSVAEPIAGNVTVEKYATVQDAKGRIIAYDATILR